MAGLEVVGMNYVENEPRGLDLQGNYSPDRDVGYRLSRRRLVSALGSDPSSS